MIEIDERLVYWTAPHPSWRPGAEWPREVGCVLYRHPEELLLIDPLVEDDDLTWLDPEADRAERPVVVLLTAPWHLRSAPVLTDRYGATVWASPRARQRLGSLPWADELPAGLRALEPRGVDEGQVALFLEAERTLVVAEVFLGTKDGLEVRPSPATTDAAAFTAWLGELKTLPVERVLVAHGPPVFEKGVDAIADALRRFGA